ncbi:PEP-CTERM sorting domain-containing protein [Coraliomargarita sp. SDUM461003]|uniref:PEP-CTERM sorting domain-containing protein n=1 Tax=Thalassobacterium maritimum TaxID=3041265 RepID=A0ABU1B0X8_9BACT|nr:PEP-CTERM sorting domain-containing protein [Coraliomargarita sp. SDUM461003]MDQ8209244.1 PEP-CTERM sorting domain-containing protein [Coraliomargarita sp. SDUM461003]
MKKNALFSLSLVGLFVANAQALTIIDGGTRNGSFESATATGVQYDAEFWSFGFNSDQVQRQDNDSNTPDGSYSLVIGTNNDGSVHNGAYQLTGYEVGAGDRFSLSFSWGAAYQWVSGDDINWRLFTTEDNTTTGTITEIASGFVTGKSASTLPLTNWSTADVLVEGGTITSSNIGQLLFVEFYEANGINQFARIDNVVLSVVPEPATFGLFAGGIALVSMMIRRRVSK